MRRRLRQATPTLTILALTTLCLVPTASGAPETETLYLSGTGRSDAVDWEFFSTGGRAAGEWTTIPVPSQWELQGFGTYNYGHDKNKSDEVGRYRYRFRHPEGWREKTVDLVFDGVMTDAEVRVNGERAGPVHQGAFYRFRYDVTTLLRAGENVLEVDVRKKSSDTSVNRAERDADYWVFGGIFRPVYLEAFPPESIEHMAIDARHDGTLRLRARLRGLGADVRVTGQVLSTEGEEIGEPFSSGVTKPDATAELETRLHGAVAWSAETPHLYRLRLDLERDGELLHRRIERFGFRTVEVVRDRGLFVNGHRVLLKGVNRHAFWPDSGRTLDRDLDRRDALLVKSMNMNAVRASHYPPDESFLDACDELGIYVLDELAGWHDAYDTGVGRRLVREVVERDLNHPSILFWDNGNEGGWNGALDGVFGEHDLQDRPVLRPDAVASGIDTRHYLTWEELRGALAPWPRYRRWIFGEPPLVMPTELLHGLYDGGSGASLGDYWRALRASPRGAGAFLWSFIDEAVVRTDRGGELDTDGNHAPDGVLGPYRELSGNYYAVREVFSPVVLAGEELDDGVVEVENRYDMTDLSAVRFRWAWVSLPGPDDEDRVLAELAVGETPGPRTAPGRRGRVLVPRPPADGADALRLAAIGPDGRDVLGWVLPHQGRRALAARFVEEGEGTVTVEEGDGLLRLRTGATEAVFDLGTGKLKTLNRGGQRFELDGPYDVTGGEAALASFRHWADGSGQVVEVRYEKGLKAVRWKLHPSGWLRLSYQLRLGGEVDFFGIGFPVPEDRIRNVEWLGRGPARVWKNRREGGVLGVWAKERAAAGDDRWAHEPVFAGFYGGVYWARLGTSGGTLTVVLADDLDLGVLAPAFPADARDAVAAVPSSGLTILNGIPAIGTKFHPADELGPQGEPHRVDGVYGGTVWLR